MPLVWIVAACNLTPLFSRFNNDFSFDCYDALSIGKEFFFNHYSSNFIFDLVDHQHTIQDQAAEAASECRAIEEEARCARAACVGDEWTGNEAREAEKSFLPIIASHPSSRAVFATHTMMDLFSRLHQRQLNENDLARMDDDLRGFHNNKEIFRRLGGLTSLWGWNGIPKLHAPSHYTHQIREYGTADNYDTEIPERLHRYYVKNPYRQCSKSGEILAQMIIRLRRQENWVELRSKLERAGVLKELKFKETSKLADGDHRGPTTFRPGIQMAPNGQWIIRRDQQVYHLSPRVMIAKRPRHHKLRGSDLIRDFGVPDFIDALKEYIDDIKPQMSYLVDETSNYAVWTRCDLQYDTLPFAPLEGGFKDVLRTQPGSRDMVGRVTRETYYDCALIQLSTQHQGLFRYQAARVRVIFQVPAYLRREIPQHLALVELFTPFSSPQRISSLVTTKPLIRNGQRVTKEGMDNSDNGSCDDNIHKMSFGMYDPLDYHLVFTRLGLQPPPRINGSSAPIPLTAAVPLNAAISLNESRLDDTSPATNGEGPVPDPVDQPTANNTGNPPVAPAAESSMTNTPPNQLLAMSLIISQTATIRIDEPTPTFGQHH
ncbi:hypothetical protein FRC11_009938 [Ceratobasidium sp. 423]|nr:hypothetical protein FRC11_009938 [Ceratobasidium sp. 423]